MASFLARALIISNHRYTNTGYPLLVYLYALIDNALREKGSGYVRLEEMVPFLYCLVHHFPLKEYISTSLSPFTPFIIVYFRRNFAHHIEQISYVVDYAIISGNFEVSDLCFVFLWCRKGVMRPCVHSHICIVIDRKIYDLWPS